MTTGRQASGDAIRLACAHSKRLVTKVNAARTPAEVEALRKCIARGVPCGEERWTERIAKRLGLESSLRPRGRPKNVAFSQVVKVIGNAESLSSSLTQNFYSRRFRGGSKAVIQGGQRKLTTDRQFQICRVITRQSVSPT